MAKLEVTTVSHQGLQILGRGCKSEPPGGLETNNVFLRNLKIHGGKNILEWAPGMVSLNTVSEMLFAWEPLIWHKPSLQR